MLSFKEKTVGKGIGGLASGSLQIKRGKEKEG
jgi:hypothetical protein